MRPLSGFPLALFAIALVAIAPAISRAQGGGGPVKPVEVTNTPLPVSCQSEPEFRFVGLTEAVTVAGIGRFGLNGLCADGFGTGARLCEFAEVQDLTPQAAGEGWLNSEAGNCGNWVNTSGVGATIVFQLQVGGRVISGTRSRSCNSEISVACCAAGP